MRRYGQIGWRVAAIAAFVGTAALAVVLTRVPGNAVAALSSDTLRPRVRGLRPRGLARAGGRRHGRAGVGLSHGGGTYYTLEFTNVSHQACRLYGYPEVSAYQDSPVAGENEAGGQIGGPAVRDTSVRPTAGDARSPGRPRTPCCGSWSPRAPSPPGCTRVTAEELRVALPSQGRAAFVPVHIPVCSSKGVRLAERPGHPGPAGRPRIRRDALTQRRLHVRIPGLSAAPFGRIKVLKILTFPTGRPTGTMSCMGVSQISLPAEGHEDEGAPGDRDRAA